MRKAPLGGAGEEAQMRPTSEDSIQDASETPAGQEFDCYSVDGDTWLEGGRDDALFALVENAEGRIEPGVTYRLGVRVPYGHDRFVDADSLIERMQEDAWAEVDELAEEYLEDVTAADRQSLTSILREWFEKHALQPAFWHVARVTEFAVTDEDLGRFVDAGGSS